MLTQTSLKGAGPLNAYWLPMDACGPGLTSTPWRASRSSARLVDDATSGTERDNPALKGAPRAPQIEAPPLGPPDTQPPVPVAPPRLQRVLQTDALLKDGR